MLMESLDESEIDSDEEEEEFVSNETRVCRDLPAEPREVACFDRLSIMRKWEPESRGRFDEEWDSIEVEEIVRDWVSCACDCIALLFEWKVALVVWALIGSFELVTRGSRQRETVQGRIAAFVPSERHGSGERCNEQAKSFGFRFELVLFKWVAAMEKILAAPKRKWEMRPEAIARVYWAFTAQAHEHFDSDSCELDRGQLAIFREEPDLARVFIKKPILKSDILIN